MKRKAVNWFVIRCVLALGLAFSSPTGLCRADDEPESYLRAVAEETGVRSLEVAVRELLPSEPESPRVWLVGVIHIGAPDYYEELQAFLDEQSIVLFEGIGAEDGDFDLQDNSFSLQEAMADALGLQFQLAAIDYDRDHFKNSDLDREGLARLFGGTVSAGGPTGSGGAADPDSGGAEFNMLIQIMEGRGLLGGLAKWGVSAIAASPRLQASSKLMLIEMLGNLPPNLGEAAGLPPGAQRLMEGLIEDRNAVVVRDVRAQMHSRKGPESVAVFYGAAHMVHLESNLCRELGFTPGENRWHKAIEVDPEESGLTAWELRMTHAMARLQLRTLAGQRGRSDN